MVMFRKQSVQYKLRKKDCRKKTKTRVESTIRLYGKRNRRRSEGIIVEDLKQGSTCAKPAHQQPSYIHAQTFHIKVDRLFCQSI